MAEITQQDLVPGKRIVVANQGVAITYQWRIAEIVTVGPTDVWYRLSDGLGARKRVTPAQTPIDRFLAIVNAEPRGPHHTPKPRI